MDNGKLRENFRAETKLQDGGLLPTFLFLLSVNWTVAMTVDFLQTAVGPGRRKRGSSGLPADSCMTWNLQLT